METHRGSDISDRTRSSTRPKRKPFSDLTNTLPSSSLLKPNLKLNPKHKSTPPLDPEPAYPEPAFSSTAGEQENDGDLARSASTPISKEAASNSGQIKASKKGKEKVMEATPVLSCPPLGRIQSIERNVRLKDHISSLHKAFTVPRERTKKRKWLHRTAVRLQKKPILPPDFVEKQRAYFAEIDAFELPEEEVSDIDQE